MSLVSGLDMSLVLELGMNWTKLSVYCLVTILIDEGGGHGTIDGDGMVLHHCLVCTDIIELVPSSDPVVT